MPGENGAVDSMVLSKKKVVLDGEFADVGDRDNIKVMIKNFGGKVMERVLKHTCELLLLVSGTMSVYIILTTYPNRLVFILIVQVTYFEG